MFAKSQNYQKSIHISPNDKKEKTISSIKLLSYRYMFSVIKIVGLFRPQLFIMKRINNLNKSNYANLSDMVLSN